MVLRRIGVLSSGKIMGAMYLLLGLIIGLIYALVVFIMFVVGSAGSETSGSMAAIGIAGGLLMAVLVPLFYGVMGFLGGLLMAAIYNFIVKFTGGLELELSQRVGQATSGGTGFSTTTR